MQPTRLWMTWVYLLVVALLLILMSRAIEEAPAPRATVSLVIQFSYINSTSRHVLDLLEEYYGIYLGYHKIVVVFGPETERGFYLYATLIPLLVGTVKLMFINDDLILLGGMAHNRFENDLEDRCWFLELRPSVFTYSSSSPSAEEQLAKHGFGDWKHWTHALPALMAAQERLRLEPSLQADGVILEGSFPDHTPSDFMYLPTWIQPCLHLVLSVCYEERVFLEAAVPFALHICAGKNPGRSLHVIGDDQVIYSRAEDRMSTHWLETIRPPPEIDRLLFVHPIKLGPTDNRDTFIMWLQNE